MRATDDVRDQRERLLARLGEQTFRLIADGRMPILPDLVDAVEKLASLLGVQVHLPAVTYAASTVEPPPMEAESAERSRGTAPTQPRAAKKIVPRTPQKAPLERLRKGPSKKKASKKSSKG